MFTKEADIDHGRHFLGQDAVFFTQVVVIDETSGVCPPRAAVQVSPQSQPLRLVPGTP